MKLSEMMFCPQCFEVFSYDDCNDICPVCTNKYTQSFNSILKELNGEFIVGATLGDDVKVVSNTRKLFVHLKKWGGKLILHGFPTENIDELKEITPDIREEVFLARLTFDKDKPYELLYGSTPNKTKWSKIKEGSLDS